MIQKHFLIYLTLALLSTISYSCNDEVQVVETSSNDLITDSDISYLISIETATKSLDDFMKDVTRSRSGSYSISNIRAIYSSNTKARSSQNSPLLYIANFENEEGYAILSADERISEPVIAVIDQGSCPNLVSPSVNKEWTEKMTRPLVKGYPLTGPGFITLDDYPDETFMNPNTVNLYSESEGDTLVGNFWYDDIEFLDLTLNDSTEFNNPISRLPLDLGITYAEREIENYNNPCNSSGGSDDNRHGYDEFEYNTGLNDPPGGSSPYDLELGPWRTTKEIRPLLSSMMLWNQHSPYNDLYPKRRKYILLGKQSKAPAGCFPLSIAKVLTHFKYPAITYNGRQIDYNTLSNPVMQYTDDYKSSAASLLRCISNGCDCLYFYAGTFTFPQKAVKFMKFLGFREVCTRNYDLNRVVTQLEAGSPVIVYGMPSWHIWKSHCWNIDGYFIKERDRYIRYYRINEETGEKEYGQTMQSKDYKTRLHCDFGQGGQSNGYYVSGVFNTKNPNVEFDETGDTKHFNYNGHLRILYYEK